MYSLIVASDTRVWKDGEIDTTFLRANCLYKMLSLVEASRAGIHVLPTLLLLNMNQQAINSVIELWKLPLMVRMEYKSLPKSKLLGGIPLYTPKAIDAVAKFLFQQTYYPMFHPHSDRFKNIYSVGILIDANSSEVQIEVVGTGFDASDLRFGDTTPHEYLKMDILSSSVLQHSVIAPSDYLRRRGGRIEKVRRFQEYIKYANGTGQLLPSLDSLSADVDKSSENDTFIPEGYNRLPQEHLDLLWEIARILRAQVSHNLPRSNGLVASLSYLPNKGWTLWDIYGQWYRR